MKSPNLLAISLSGGLLVLAGQVALPSSVPVWRIAAVVVCVVLAVFLFVEAYRR